MRNNHSLVILRTLMLTTRSSADHHLNGHLPR